MTDENFNNLLIDTELTKSKLQILYARYAKLNDDKKPNFDRIALERSNKVYDDIFAECAKKITTMPVWKRIIENDKAKGELTTEELYIAVMTKALVIYHLQPRIDHKTKEYAMFCKICDKYFNQRKSSEAYVV